MMVLQHAACLLLATLLASGGNSLARVQYSGSPSGSGQGERTLASASTRSELLETLGRLVALRHRTNPHGYEKDLKFSEEFYPVGTRISKLLEAEGPIVLSPAAPQTIASLLREYDENHEDFVAFLKSTSERGIADQKLAAMAPSDIAANIMTLFLVVSMRDQELAELLKKSSYIWPFCRAHDHMASSNEAGITPTQLLSVIEGLRKNGFSTPFQLETIQHVRLLKHLSADDLARWKNSGIPDEIIQAALRAKVISP